MFAERKTDPSWSLVGEAWKKKTGGGDTRGDDGGRRTDGTGRKKEKRGGKGGEDVRRALGTAEATLGADPPVRTDSARLSRRAVSKDSDG